MLTLYDFLPSGNGYKVRFTLRELRVPFVYREVDILRGESHAPWFLAKNPVGQIPVLELDDAALTCLSESTAILFHLAQGTHLLPDEPIARTRVLQWMAFEQTHVDGVISRARFRRLYPHVIPTRPEEFEAWWSQGKHALHVLDDHLTKEQQKHQGQASSWLVGPQFSIADITLFAYVHRAEEGGFDMQPYEAIARWINAIKSRPAYLPIDEIPR